MLPTLAGAGLVRDVADYLTPYSDIAALLVLEHQLHADEPDDARRLGASLGRLAAVAAPPRRRRPGRCRPACVDAVDELVDYLLFVDEVPLGVVQGNVGFTEWFSAQGPKDATGRSLRQLQLNGRLMRYPLSYTVYSAAFETLPLPVKMAVYQRLWDVLSGKDTQAKYAHVSKADRQAIIEILRATRSDLPDAYTTTAVAR